MQKAVKKEASKAKREIEKLKKRDRQDKVEPEADTISLESVKRHVYSGFIITLSLMLVVSTQGHAPIYAISDNGANLKKAMELLDFRHHRDIGHTFATFVRKVYEKDPEYMNFSSLIGKTTHLALSDMAYLMPCKQRSIARFMNLYPVIDWSKSVLDNYHRLSDKERYHFSFIPRNASLIEELDENLSCIESIMTICKNDGFSIATVARSKDLIRRSMMPGGRSQ